MNAKQLVENLAKALVDSPDEVSVNEVWGEKASVIQLKVAKSDLGKVIGKQGKNASDASVHCMTQVLTLPCR